MRRRHAFKDIWRHQHVLYRSTATQVCREQNKSLNQCQNSFKPAGLHSTHQLGVKQCLSTTTLPILTLHHQHLTSTTYHIPPPSTLSASPTSLLTPNTTNHPLLPIIDQALTARQRPQRLLHRAQDIALDGLGVRSVLSHLARPPALVVRLPHLLDRTLFGVFA